MYARCYNIFKECLRKLADVIVNNDLVYLASARQPPEAKEVEKLYKELWGKIGPPDPQYQKVVLQEGSFANIFHP